MAGVARLVGKRRMQKLPHQLWRRRLMRIMTTGAISLLKWLVLMCLLQCCIFHIVAIDAERGRSFGQMKIELRFSHLAGLMSDVARIAAHIQRGVPASLLRHIQSFIVAIEAEILSLV